MKTLKNLLLGLVLAVFTAIPGWSQHTLTSTTFSANVDRTQITFAVASATGVEVGDIAWANGEAMAVRAISGTTLTVRRGVQGTAIAQHTSGDTIYIDEKQYFREFSIGYEPRGSSRCTTAEFPFDVSPLIDLRSGTVLNCTSSRVAPQGVTDMALTSPTVTTDIRSVTAGSATLGTAALPFGSAYIGGAATNNFIITGTATAARTFTLPDLASTTFAMIGGTQTLTGKTLTSPTLTTPALGVATGTGLINTGTSANILTAGRVGATNPVFNVDASAATVATGLNVVGAAAAGGLAVSVTSSAANEALTVNAKGSGTIGIGNVSTGAVTITPATTVTGTLAATNAATVGTTLAVTGATTLSGAVTQKAAVISGSGATATLTAAQSGSVVAMDRAAGIVFTLPAPAVGLYYDFLANVSVTSNNYKVITDAGTTFILGSLVNIDTDTSNAVAAWTGNGTTHVAITMNGTTTGGLLGTMFRLTCISSTVWMVQGIDQGNGVVATPFATS